MLKNRRVLSKRLRAENHCAIDRQSRVAQESSFLRGRFIVRIYAISLLAPIRTEEALPRKGTRTAQGKGRDSR
jgi:hypothetical protein